MCKIKLRSSIDLVTFTALNFFCVKKNRKNRKNTSWQKTRKEESRRQQMQNCRKETFRIKRVLKKYNFCQNLCLLNFIFESLLCFKSNDVIQPNFVYKWSLQLSNKVCLIVKWTFYLLFLVQTLFVDAKCFFLLNNRCDNYPLFVYL